ncbi:Subunit of heteropentameric Replication factor C (RF-C) [Brettanomyces bruxellensis]|uniref:Replication factor C subunit 3 n=1 Tax=Dekkera bruxellensis TaxID=5007 RepID=A0A871R8P1_DEKBR|nr:Subunit of heteropentameric Replication factor C (RF-C) [Brettanomyces bruxellensis]QOU21074.1 Subunit of heteropentameric Replication factor C (RF-C) [Brettanomyces bruxellensis]
MPNRELHENLPWVEKYRPQNLDQVYGQQETIQTIRKFAQDGRIPHLLFYGPPGSGKTSTIIALAREIYGKNYRNMVLELNASDDRGIDIVRDQIKNFASTRQIFSSGFKLVILDEADAMTNTAQNALRRIIEKYTKNTRFCILANYAHKINPALMSRCTRFRFSPLAISAIEERVDTVIKEEKLKIEKPAEKCLVTLSKGDMRKALNVLQACAAALDKPEDTISVDMIYECVGAPRPKSIEVILNAIMERDWTDSYSVMNKIRKTEGLALIDLIEGFMDILAKYELKPLTRIKMIQGLGDIEYGISKGGSDKIQSTAVIGCIKNALENEA